MSSWIEILGARQHNLKNIDVRFPRGALSVVTGPSGSGKSSLAFNTLFAEGQRRFMESLSTYVRQFLDKQEKPDVDEIRGITPTIALEQKNQTKNSRSTVGTSTEVYDYLRLLYAKLGKQYDPETGAEVKKNLVNEVSEDLLKRFSGDRLYIGYPLEFFQKSKIADRKTTVESVLSRGFTYVVPQEVVEVGEAFPAEDLQNLLAQKGSGLLGKSNSKKIIYIITDRSTIDTESRGRIEEALVQAYREGFGRARAWIIDSEGLLKEEQRLTDYPSTDEGTKRYPELSPLLFSFNSPLGACEKCRGFGNILTLDPTLVVPNPRLTIAQGAIDPLSKPSARDWLKKLILFCKAERISLNLPWSDLSEAQKQKVWSGGEGFRGVEALFEDLEEEKYKTSSRVFLSRYRSPKTCTSCKGDRLRPEARAVKFHGKSVSELCRMNIAGLRTWFTELKLNKSEKIAAKDILHQVHSRLDFLCRVGLEYLTMNRLARTLSGGETQRIALANQLGTRLTQTTYVLDEPSIGLHPRDTQRLIGILRDLAALKNTVVVVEHDPDLIEASEYLVDLGPEAGEAGGEVIYQGPTKDFLTQVDGAGHSFQFLKGKRRIPFPRRRRMDRFKDKKREVRWLELHGCRENNLKNVDVRIPLGMMTCISGVSGSGKSSAIRRTLYPALARILMQEIDEVGAFQKIRGFEGLSGVQLIDQEPIGRSPRSNPITFLKAYDSIRELFSQTQEARRKGYHPGFFSFNIPGGRCETCEGEGYVRVEMVFMEDLFLLCDDCEGKRFKKEILEIQFQGKNIDNVLRMTVAEAKRFFATERRLTQALSVLEKVGLGYLRLGQPSNTLSGGESQRLKIARELLRNEGGSAVYVMDEPTTGLHLRDIAILLGTLNELVERGNTLIIIEHNLDVLKFADWIIDFGPEGGDLGGYIVDEGSPEDIVDRMRGHTAQHLSAVLKSSPALGFDEGLEAQLRI
jgi:excinuclease ABC subunit A